MIRRHQEESHDTYFIETENEADYFGERKLKLKQNDFLNLL